MMASSFSCKHAAPCTAALPPRPTVRPGASISMRQLPQQAHPRAPTARHSFSGAAAASALVSSNCARPAHRGLRRTSSAPAKLRNWQRHAGGRSAAIVAQWNADVQFSPAKITRSVPAAEGLQQIFIDVGLDIAAGYTKAGQYVQVKVGDSKPGFFAIASPPFPGTRVFEFLIKAQPGSTAEQLVNLPEGEVVQVSSVMGKGFPIERLPADNISTLILFATGSGISPIKALVESGTLDAKKRTDVRLYYGTRSEAVTAYQDLIPDWEASGVKVIQVFSGGSKGYVQDTFAADRGLNDPVAVGVVVCGQKGMVEGVKKVLEEEGVPADRVLSNF